MNTQTIPQLLRETTKDHPEVAAQMSRVDGGAFIPRSYRELYEEVTLFAAGLRTLGVTRGANVGLIAENRAEWFVSDLAILSLGAADVPRGNDSTAADLEFILGLPKCPVVIVENEAQLEKVLSIARSLKDLKHLVILEGEIDSKPARGVRGHSYAQIREAGSTAIAKDPEQIEREIDQGSGDDLATIIFTSGTTGEPKGVQLSHTNFLYQVGCIPERIDINPGDIWLCVLPVWHSFERIIQYLALGSATTLAYSKPIGTVMLADMAEIRPKWMASVPRIWEAVRAGIYRNIKSQGGAKEALFRFFVSVGGTHKRLSDMVRGLVPDFKKRIRILDAAIAIVPLLLMTPLKALGNALVFGKIKARLGGRFIAGVSGGGALPPAVDAFFGAAGVLLLEGYGLTETAPLLTMCEAFAEEPGMVAIEGIEIRIAHPNESGVGEILARGPNIMLGYYKNQAATDEVIDADGWFHTGDLGTYKDGRLQISGRAKNVIVLETGKNVYPEEIEWELVSIPEVEEIMVHEGERQGVPAVCAQIYPKWDVLKEQGAEDPGAAIEALWEAIKTRNENLAPFKRIRFKECITLVDEPFQKSAKLDIKRHLHKSDPA